MSFDTEIQAGFAESDRFAGNSFTLSNHTGVFRGVFRGDQVDTSYDDLRGYDETTKNEASVNRNQFIEGLPPMVNESLTLGTDIYLITQVNPADAATWDLQLTKSNG